MHVDTIWCCREHIASLVYYELYIQIQEIITHTESRGNEIVITRYEEKTIAMVARLINCAAHVSSN